MSDTSSSDNVGQKPIEDSSSLEDMVATNLLGMSSEELYNSTGSASLVEKANFRYFFSNLINVFDNPETVIQNIDNGTLTSEQIRVLNYLTENGSEQYVEQYINEYVSVIIDEYQYEDQYENGDIKDTYVDPSRRGYQIYYLLDKYKKYKAAKDSVIAAGDPFNYIIDALKTIGGDSLEPDFSFMEHSMEDIVIRSFGKFREDTPPRSVAPWQCRIGGSTFFVPPTSVSVSQVFKAGSFSGAAIRQPNSPKFNTGHSETTVEMTLFFPNHETIWGFTGDAAEFIWDSKDGQNNISSDQEIDFFLSSLRGLVTQFKYAPFLPVRNQYLNQAHDIHAVTLLGMTVQTMPDYPFCLVVNLQMAKFNHKVYLPMIEDFDQAIHWGKYRQYMGKAAARLDSYVNQGFLTTKKMIDSAQAEMDRAEIDWVKAGRPSDWRWPDDQSVVVLDGDLPARFDKAADIRDGRNFELFFPRSTPSRIFSPDTTDFRQPGENDVVTREKWDGILGLIGIKAVDRPNFNFFEYDTLIKNRQVTNERTILLNWLNLQKLTWEGMNSGNYNDFVNWAMENAVKSRAISSDKQSADYVNYKNRLKLNWFAEIYNQYLSDPFFKKKIEQQQIENNDYIINEWKVPMERVWIDWDSCFVQGVSVSLSNNIARLQVQMQDEPVHQHIGGGDSTVNVSMMVVGERNLSRLRRVFDHIGGLARLEHGHGVLGFLGIKNIVTSICGIKYVIPLSFEVDTVPNYPRVYEVRMSFVDFDIFQQKREQLSSAQQKDLVEAFGKRNPFLRIKQKWSAFNAYPDLPLDIRDEDNKVLSHFDPDWYFRSFRPNDDRTYNWVTQADLASKLSVYSLISKNPPLAEDPNHDQIIDYRQRLLREIMETVQSGVELPDGWSFDARGNIISTGNPVLKSDGIPLRYYLGTMDEKQDKVYYVEQSQAGAVTLGSQDVKTGKDDELFLREHAFREDIPSQNAVTTAIPNAVPFSSYQKEYWKGSDNPTIQFETMMKDWNYRQLDGRMIRAFPTYMLWLIDEGGRFAGVKLFDNFYGLNSVIDFSVVQSEDSIEDTLILRVSNLFQRLSTPYKDQIIAQDDPLLDTAVGKVISIFENRNRNFKSGLTNEIVEINNIRLKPGIRVHLRAGYGANPNTLQTVFNGVITEVQQGDIMTIVAQSDAVELTAQVNTTNKKGHSGTLDGGFNTGFWMSEPRDLMVRLLSMGSSAFKEWVAWGTKGVIFSENRFGIRHFGNMLYEPMTTQEKQKSLAAYVTAGNGVAASSSAKGPNEDRITESLGSLTQSASQADLGSLMSFGSFSGIFQANLWNIMQGMWVNSFKKRDYEIFKRNIYPGNGLGIAQFMAGDQIDAGVLVSTMTSSLSKAEIEKESRKYEPRSVSEVAADNLAIIDSAKADLGMSRQDDSALLKMINENDFKAPDIDIGFEEDNGGVFDLLWNGFKFIEKQMNPFGALSGAFELAGIDIPGANLLGMGPIASVVNTINVVKRVSSSPFGQLFGLTSVMEDDDLPGYDEVSFRAQTYMKTVWDLFRTCAALLPNYIVAVRPFEDRSTVFYGKPHWLYTSGVVPISKGVNVDAKPLIEEADDFLREMQRIASQSLSSFEEMQRQLADIASLDSQASQMADTINAGAAATGGIVSAPEKIMEMPTEWEDGKAFIPISEGRVSLEMHLPTKGTESAESGQTSIAQETSHKQLPDLPTEMRWPYYMDRNDGDGAGGKAPSIKSDGYVTNWGGGENIIGNSGKTIGNEDPNRPGQGGAFGLLPPDVEQWYISSFWPYDTSRFVGKGEKYEAIARKAEERGVKKKDYQYKHVLVYAPSTRKAVVCAVGEWGPNPGFREEETGVPFVAGISPDATFYLGVTRGETIILRAVEDSIPLGPYTDIPEESRPNYDVSGGKPSDEKAVIPSTGDSFTPTDSYKDDVKGWIDWTLTRIEEDIKNATTAEELSAYNKAKDMLQSNPLVFAYHFGWKYDTVPIYVDIESGIGNDVVGTNARKMYDSGFEGATGVPGDGKSITAAMDIWEDFRYEYPDHTEPLEIFKKYYPLNEDFTRYKDVLDLFMRFMWQIPSNRAWIVTNAERVVEGVITQAVDTAINVGGAIDFTGVTGDTGDAEGNWEWDWSFVNPVFEAFISSGDLSLDSNGVPYSPSARAYMESNNRDGSSKGNIIARSVEDVKGWFDDNIGQFIGLVTDTLQGFLAMLRMSMMQIGVGLSLAGTMQKQANVLNAMFNDSIYYAEGEEGSLLRLVDNPFTREYGEPVIEIREPFQRIHFISSFQHILDNSISENLTNVPTVVTATSDGKYPVTVHFDKGMPPERQTETAVDTGLFWDNAVGSGITGMFQPLFHPIEALRSVAKTATASSDLLSSKRVALWHLKEGLKDIYTGELLILGNSDIRPHDLIYMADVYERMYGMFEVEKVIHHFTPESGFVTSIVPNAIVTVNDPARWSMLSWVWRKFSEHNIRNDARAMLSVKADRNAALASTTGLESQDIPNIFSNQLLGSIQYTQGNTALIRDLAAVSSMGGLRGLTAADQLTNSIAKIDQNLLAAKAGLTVGGIAVGGVLAATGVGIPAAVAVGAGGYVIGDLMWKAWGWVKDNLLDQHGCYIQFLNKDGQPMDAGLSYAQGVAVGQHHSITLFPDLLGVKVDTNIVKDGNYRITSNDLLAALGWSEIETAYIQRQTSWFVDQINSEVLKIAGRSPDPIVNDNAEVIVAEVLDPFSDVNENNYPVAGVIDGDTFYVRVIEGKKFAPGSRIKIRLAGANTSELYYKSDEIQKNLPNDIALLATKYLQLKFTDPDNRVIAVRLDVRGSQSYDRTVGVVFDKLPPGTASNITKQKRGEILKSIAQREPVIPWDAYMEDGRPYTLNWEIIMAGYGNVDMRDSQFTKYRDGAISPSGG